MSELTVEHPDAVFEVDFECQNCGAGWTEQCRPKTEIYASSASAVKVLDKTHDHFPIRDCNYCHAVYCPVCELTQHVIVEDRNPIDE